MSCALELESVSLRLGRGPVLRDLTLHLLAGGVRALVGLNGAGKTTALRVALGMLRPDAGRVRVLGQDLRGAEPRVWRRVGHLVESPAAYPELTARENIAAAAALHGATAFRAARRTEDLAEQLALTDDLDTRVRGLSLGNRQKVGIISALVHDPALVVIDEPTNGLDPLAVIAFRDLLRDLAGRGTAVLLTSHHVDELARLADRVDVLHHGRVVDSLMPDGGDLERAVFATLVSAERAAREDR